MKMYFNSVESSVFSSSLIITAHTQKLEKQYRGSLTQISVLFGTELHVTLLILTATIDYLGDETRK